MKSTDQIFHLSTFSDSNSFMAVGPDDLLHMGGGALINNRKWQHILHMCFNLIYIYVCYHIWFNPL